MKPAATKNIDRPAWQNSAQGNEQNDGIKWPTNETVKTVGNLRSAEMILTWINSPAVTTSSMMSGNHAVFFSL